jgi:hypothetical protein
LRDTRLVGITVWFLHRGATGTAQQGNTGSGACLGLANRANPPCEAQRFHDSPCNFQPRRVRVIGLRLNGFANEREQGRRLGRLHAVHSRPKARET